MGLERAGFRHRPWIGLILDNSTFGMTHPGPRELCGPGLGQAENRAVVSQLELKRVGLEEGKLVMALSQI